MWVYDLRLGCQTAGKSPLSYCRTSYSAWWLWTEALICVFCFYATFVSSNGFFFSFFFFFFLWSESKPRRETTWMCVFWMKSGCNSLKGIDLNDLWQSACEGHSQVWGQVFYLMWSQTKRWDCIAWMKESCCVGVNLRTRCEISSFCVRKD